MNRPPSSSQTPEAAASSSLRERAEKLFRETLDSSLDQLDALSPEALRATLHELRVHQIELELQNEELLRAQVALDASRALYFDLYDMAPVGYCTVGETGRILQANLTAASLLGMARGELLTENFSFFIGKENQDAFYLVRKKLVETGKPQTCDLRMVRPDGRAFFAHLKITSALDEKGGTVCRVVLIDVTIHREAEEKLRTLQTAVEQSANTVVITDTSGNIEYVNPAFEKSTGYTAAEATGINPRVLKSGRHEAAFYQNLWTTITSGRIWRGEFQNRRKDGSLYWESATITPVLDSHGKTVAYIAVKEDITARKSLEASRAEAAARTEAANRAKSEFLAIMSHELRTPLNGVLGFAELLAETPLSAEQMGFARIISQSGNHLLQVVNDILDFSSIEKGHVPLESAPVAIASLVESSVVPSRKAASDKGLELLCEMAPGLPEQIAGDERRIRQILINLIGNAVKFTARGSVVVRVAPSSLAGRPALDFSVEDTGTGIHGETIGLLFKPFVQEDMTLHRPFEGTGLGLAISQRLAEAMGGAITVQSALGQGSTFTLHLPLEAPGAEGIPPAPAKPLPPATDSAKTGGAPNTGRISGMGILPMRDFPNMGKMPMPRFSAKLPVLGGAPVLVVEDDDSNSDLVGKMLHVLGFRAEFAFDGQQAVQAFAPGKYIAILMDMQMPVMDGLAATRKIREIEGVSGARVPIIAVTANVMPGDLERCLAAGMDDFLSKPFNKAALAGKLAGVAPNKFPAES
ncbi:MAG: PAS domain S-box protein [Verrucomicrobiota bacterium]